MAEVGEGRWRVAEVRVRGFGGASMAVGLRKRGRGGGVKAGPAMVVVRPPAEARWRGSAGGRARPDSRLAVAGGGSRKAARLGANLSFTHPLPLFDCTHDAPREPERESTALLAATRQRNQAKTMAANLCRLASTSASVLSCQPQPPSPPPSLLLHLKLSSSAPRRRIRRRWRSPGRRRERKPRETRAPARGRRRRR